MEVYKDPTLVYLLYNAGPSGPMSGYPNMLQLTIITYISILFLKPHLNHPGQRRVTQASITHNSALVS